MRLKITQAIAGSIDGIQLSQFVVGCVYDVILVSPIKGNKVGWEWGVGASEYN